MRSAGLARFPWSPTQICSSNQHHSQHTSVNRPNTSTPHPTGRLHWSWPLFNIYHRVSAGACEEQPEQWAEDTHICWGTLWTKEQQCVQYSSLQGLVRAHAVHSAPLSKHADTWHDMNDSVTYRKPIIWSTSNEALALLKPAAEVFFYSVFTSQHSCVSVQLRMRQKNTARRSFEVDYHAQITWIVTDNNREVRCHSWTSCHQTQHDWGRKAPLRVLLWRNAHIRMQQWTWSYFAHQTLELIFQWGLTEL